jgi:quaternary ammonium compound-resistance protein SugE
MLLLAGGCEITWAVMLKASKGFTQPLASVGTIAFNILSVVLLALAMRKLPLGTSYAVWTGIGAVGTVAYGMIFLKESHEIGRLVCITLILAGILGLKVLTPTE